jgi:hypothetical protein
MSDKSMTTTDAALRTAGALEAFSRRDLQSLQQYQDRAAAPAGANGKWDDEEGIIDNYGNRLATKKLSGLHSSRRQTLSCVGLVSQNSGVALTVSSNTIAPTSSIHEVGAGLIKTVTVPSGFTSGSIDLVPTAAFTYDATGNILGSGTAVVGRTMRATYNSVSSKWSMSY